MNLRIALKVAELLRVAARAGGVHLFTESDCNVYANGPYLVLHASQDGPLKIDVGRAGAGNPRTSWDRAILSR